MNIDGVTTGIVLDHIKAGKATVTIIGINGYTGKRTVNFIIKKIDLKTADPDLLNIDIAENAIYNKNGANLSMLFWGIVATIKTRVAIC